MKNDKIKITHLILLLITVLVMWVLNLLIVPLLTCNVSEWSAYGEMFGAVNSLFSGMALAGIIFTIYVQLKEIKQNSHEMRESVKLSAMTALLIAYNAVEQSNREVRTKRDALILDIENIINTKNEEED